MESIARKNAPPEIPARLVRIPVSCAGRRLDQVLAELYPGFSRSRLAELVREGRVRLSGRAALPSRRVKADESLEVDFGEPLSRAPAGPEPMGLTVVWEDADLIVVNKPAGLVVHPGAGHHGGTLLNGLLYRYPELDRVPRGGLVHRLDKDTSGLLVIARNEPAHTRLTRAIAAREVRRVYWALVLGEPTAGQKIEAPLGRDRRNRQRRAVVPSGKPADTTFRIRERFTGACLIEASLGTGRTHQIRVHLAHVGYPLVGDPLYGGRSRSARGMCAEVREAVRTFSRQALHAQSLSFRHPGTREPCEWEAPLPQDLEDLLGLIRAAEAGVHHA